MIGDEVLFVADSPADGAEIALTLAERAGADPRLPELRIGLAYGRVLHRLGDVYGPVVNIAARLTALARPTTILADGALAGQIRPLAGYRLRSLRPVSVRGYARLKPYVVRRTGVR
jgi:adenylate cyclase